METSEFLYSQADESWFHGSRQRPHQILRPHQKSSTLIADEIHASKSPDMKLPPQKINNRCKFASFADLSLMNISTGHLKMGHLISDLYQIYEFLAYRVIFLWNLDKFIYILIMKFSCARQVIICARVDLCHALSC